MISLLLYGLGIWYSRYPGRGRKSKFAFICRFVQYRVVVMAVHRGQEELTVITKTYDLILWNCHHTGKFPRNHRFVLGERIERTLLTSLPRPHHLD